MPTPAYLDVEEQFWPAEQHHGKKIRLEGSTGYVEIYKDLSGTGGIDPILLRASDPGNGGVLQVQYIGDGADHDQFYQQKDGRVALLPFPAGTPAIGDALAADPPTGGDKIGKPTRTGQAAAIAATALVLAGVGPGFFEVSFYASTTTANPLDGTIGFQVNYSDRNGATSQASPGTLSLGALSTGATALKGCFYLWHDGASDLTYQTNLTGPQTTSRYALEVRAKFLG